MKIYILGGSQNFIENIKKALEAIGETDVTTILASKISSQELREKAIDCEILVVSPSGVEKLSKDHIAGLPKLKLISTTSVGTDWVDIAAAKGYGVIVCNEKGVNAEAVAEHCFGMILDLAKRITEADRDIRTKGEYRFTPYMGFELYKKTLGIIGLGDIGAKVARIAQGFSMKVIGVNKSKKKVATIGLVDLQTLLQQSDVIVVTVPLSPETENLLSEKEFRLIKEGALLISISREKIIDKDAALRALQEKRIAGFGFDADIMKSIAKDDPCLHHARIVITPHTASMTKEADNSYITMAVENVKAFLSGSPIRIVES